MLVGIDNLDIVRMEKLIQNAKFLGKYFTVYEASYVNKTASKTMRLAGIYCAKEAFLKALGIGIGGGIALNEIEVKHDALGKPYLNLSQSAKDILQQRGLNDVAISISHTKETALAICILS